jgi:hypothetical protein
MSNENPTAAVGSVIQALFNGIAGENAEQFEAIRTEPAAQKALEAIDARNPRHFHLNLLHPMDKVVSGLVNSKTQGNRDANFILIHSQYLHMHFRTWFERMEGNGACADKASTLLRALLRFYLDGKRIEFNYEAEYTYNLPQKILRTHEEIIEFFQGLHGLYYGNPDRYLQALMKLQRGAAD